MALYEYQCKKCGRKTEVIQLFSDPAPTECPHCGGLLTKLLSTPAFQFKGSGFHATDYGKSGKKEDSSKEKEADSSKGKEGDSSKGKEADAGAASEAKGDSAGDSSKEKKDSKDSSKEKSPDAAKSAGSGDSSTAPRKKSPSSS